jgi:RNA recognition motif-containing protein
LFLFTRKVEREEEEEVVVEEAKDMLEDSSEDKEIIKEIQRVHKIMAGKRSQPESSSTTTKQVVEKEGKKSKKATSKTEQEAQRVREMEQFMEESDEDNKEDSDDNKDKVKGKSNGNNLSEEAGSESEENNVEEDEDQSEEEHNNEEDKSDDEEQENSVKESEEQEKVKKDKKKFKHKKDRILIVKNLPFTVTKKQIAKLFNELAQVASVKLIEKNGKAQGKALVIFTSPEEANKGLKVNGKEFQGRKLKVKKIEIFKEQVKETGGQIFVGGLAADVSEEDMKDFFKDCGELKNVVLTVGKKKGYALVELKSSEAVKKALELSGQTLNGKKVKVEMAKEVMEAALKGVVNEKKGKVKS